ncbi:hypothetical protein [Streptomyces sp. NPDC004528]|uniref:hypothetical protein n=1 Tax=Streptomyces sp. NPDC004528 TaxID=3154550 RepID=UPI0033AC1359
MSARGALEAMANHVQGGYSAFPITRPLAESMASGNVKIPPHLLAQLPDDPDDYTEVRAQSADAGVYQQWSRTKVVYAMDELLLNELTDSTSDEVPAAIMRNIPHPDPFVLLPTPDPDSEDTAYFARHVGIPMGAFVYGKRHGARYMCSTADEDLDALGILFVGHLLLDEGGDCFQITRCTVPLDEKMTSVEHTVDWTVKNFRWSSDTQESDPARLEQWLRTHVAQVFHSVLYVGTNQPDIETYEPAKVRNGKQKKPRRPRPWDINQLVKIGYRLGPELFAERQQYENESRTSQPADGPARRSPRPHRRRGKYQIYWTGPGRTVPKSVWRRPHWVALKGQDPEGPADVVVRPVR